MSTWNQLLTMLANMVRPTSAPTTSPPLGPVIPRPNIEDMFTPEQNYARNQQFAKPGPYTTVLTPQEEREFLNWVRVNNVNWTPEDQSYDMRGFWKALKAGDPRATTAIDPGDKTLHYTDVWKTPYEATFSNQSMYALPNAPVWKQGPLFQDQYAQQNGRVIFDNLLGRWFGFGK